MGYKQFVELVGDIYAQVRAEYLLNQIFNVSPSVVLVYYAEIAVREIRHEHVSPVELA